MQFLTKIDWSLVSGKMLLIVLVIVAIGYFVKAVFGLMSAKPLVGTSVIDLGMANILKAAILYIVSPATGYIDVLLNLTVGVILVICGIYITHSGKRSRKSSRAFVAPSQVAEAD